MFTGLVEEMGEVALCEESPGGGRIEVAAALLVGQQVGASVAVNGCCLTVVSVRGPTAAFQVGPETLRLTNLGRLEPGDRVNLELPLRVGDRLGGHHVQGHIDGLAAVSSRRTEGEWVMMEFIAGPLARDLVLKGSVAVDGVSLTVASLSDDRFGVMLIPHTLSATTLGRREPGDQVNLETDVIGKHVRRFLEPFIPARDLTETSFGEMR